MTTRRPSFGAGKRLSIPAATVRGSTPSARTLDLDLETAGLIGAVVYQLQP